MSEPFAAAPLLEKLLARQDLGETEARELMEAVMDGCVSPTALAALLTALRAKGESEAEIAAFAGAMRAKAVGVAVPAGTLDTCGTGGDKSDTFNISTCTALVAAGMGIPVAKHGNRSVSSRSGSSEVLKELGVNIEGGAAVAARCLKEAGIGFLFAPAHHPGMKHAGPVRKELGIRTVFNLLGPLANPAGAKRQLLGVFTSELCDTFARVLQRMGSERALVVCGSGPGGQGHLDEVSTWGPTTVARLEDGEVRSEIFDARSLGIQPPPLEAIFAESPQASAAIIREVLAGKPGPAREIVLVNASAAAQAAGAANDWQDGFSRATKSVESGKAREALERLVKISNAR